MLGVMTMMIKISSFSNLLWGGSSPYKWIHIRLLITHSARASLSYSLPHTKLGDHDTPNAHNVRWYYSILSYVSTEWIKIHWNSICLRTRSQMTSHYTSYYTWGSVTTLHGFGGVLGRPLDTFFWALTISWSRLLARVWGGHISLLRKADTCLCRRCWFFLSRAPFAPAPSLQRGQIVGLPHAPAFVFLPGATLVLYKPRICG